MTSSVFFPPQKQEMDKREGKRKKKGEEGERRQWYDYHCLG
jgi:hypothetical protein